MADVVVSESVWRAIWGTKRCPMCGEEYEAGLGAMHVVCRKPVDDYREALGG